MNAIRSLPRLSAVLLAFAACVAPLAQAFELAPLPYPHNALVPVIDEQTMQIHHGRHHKAYVDNLNAAIAKDAALQGKTLEALFPGMSQLPAVVRNNGGGFYNHNLFWEVMGPKGKTMPGALEKAIVDSFGSVAKFKEDFAAAGAGQFGSGWAWLVKDASGALKVTKTENGVNPLCFGQKALLGCDVWEHSYYIDFRNKRPAYIANFLDKLVDWEAVASKL